MLRIDAGNGIQLRQWSESDTPLLLRLVLKNLDYLRPWMSWANDDTNEEGIRGFIASTISGLETGASNELGIWRGNQLVGAAGLHTRDRETNSAQIGYWLDADHYGQGIVTRCSAILCDRGFDVLGLARIEIHTAAANLPSQNVATRLGFQLEGRLRISLLRDGVWHDRLIFGLLSSEWKAIGGASNALARLGH